MDERPSELELLAREVTKQARGGKSTKPPQTPAESGGPPDPKKQAQDLKYTLLGLAVVLFGGCWVIGALLYDEEEDEAILMAKLLARASLKYPDEASFPWEQPHAIVSEDGVWTIVGEIIGKNAFGVKIRHAYECKLKFLGGEPTVASNWQLLGLNVAPR